MKMLCREGKSGCGRAKIPLSFFFLFFFNTLNAQVPLNGFCEVSSFETSKEYNNLFVSDINFDDCEDILLYDKISNSLLFHLSTVKKSFSQPIKKFFYFPISKIEEIGREKEKRIFLFLSRKEKLIGLASISKNEKIRLLDIISYKSTPSDFSIKRNSSGKVTEAIIYGEPFEGIALLKIEDSKISERRIFKDNVFKSAVWIDLNYDGIEDIAAYDIFGGELLLLINDGEDNYRLERRVKPKGRARELKCVDWNGNGFNDLFFSSDDGFEIFFGDSVSSFTNKNIFKTDHAPKKSAVSDFNNDGKPDVSWIEERNDGISFIFSKNDSSYSTPQKYFHGKIFADIKDSKSETDNSLFLLTKNGKVFKIKNITGKEKHKMILASGNPLLLGRFKTNRYNDLSLAYFDSLSGSVNLLMSNMDVFNDAFRFPAAKNHSEFKAFFTSDSIRTFLLFSKGEKLIEVFRFNIYNYSVSSFEIYSDYNLYDAIAVDSFHGDYLLTLTKEENAVKVNKYELNGRKFVLRENIFSENETLDALISFRKKVFVYYLKEKNDSLFLHKKTIGNGDFENEPVNLGLSGSFVPRLYLIASRKEDYPAIVNNDKRSVDILFKEKVKRFQIPEELSLPPKSVKSFYFMGFNYLFIVPQNGATMFEAQFDSRMNFLGGKNFIESESVIDYFSAEFMKFPYLFYINENNEIKFKKI